MYSDKGKLVLSTNKQEEFITIDRHNLTKGKTISNFDDYYLFYELQALSKVVNLKLFGKVVHINVHDTKNNILKCLPLDFINNLSDMHSFSTLFFNRETICAKLYMIKGKFNIFINRTYHVLSASSRNGICELSPKWYRGRS